MIFFLQILTTFKPHTPGEHIVHQKCESHTKNDNTCPAEQRKEVGDSIANLC